MEAENSGTKAIQNIAISTLRRPVMLTVDDFEQKLLEYFQDADKRKEPYSAYKLAYSMGLTFEQLKSMDGIVQSPYSRELQKRALALCEADASVRLIEGKPPIGLIFYLKNAFNWKDKREEERTFNIRVKRVRYNKKKTGPKRKTVIPLAIGEGTD